MSRALPPASVHHQKDDLQERLDEDDSPAGQLHEHPADDSLRGNGFALRVRGRSLHLPAAKGAGGKEARAAPRTLSSGELPSARRTARAPNKKTRLELDFLRLGLTLTAPKRPTSAVGPVTLNRPAQPSPGRLMRDLGWRVDVSPSRRQGLPFPASPRRFRRSRRAETRGGKDDLRPQARNQVMHRGLLEAIGRVA